MQKEGHLEGPAAGVVRAGVVAHGVIIAHEAVMGAQVHAPPCATVPLLAGRVVAQEVAAHYRLGVGGAAARAACGDLHMHRPSFTNRLAGCNGSTVQHFACDAAGQDRSSLHVQAELIKMRRPHASPNRTVVAGSLLVQQCWIAGGLMIGIRRRTGSSG